MRYLIKQPENRELTMICGRCVADVPLIAGQVCEYLIGYFLPLGPRSS